MFLHATMDATMDVCGAEEQAEGGDRGEAYEEPRKVQQAGQEWRWQARCEGAYGSTID